MEAEKQFLTQIPNQVVHGYMDLKEGLHNLAKSDHQKQKTEEFLTEFVELLAVAQNRECKNPALEKIKTHEEFPCKIAMDELHIIEKDYGNEMSQAVEHVCQELKKA